VKKNEEETNWPLLVFFLVITAVIIFCGLSLLEDATEWWEKFLNMDIEMVM